MSIQTLRHPFRALLSHFKFSAAVPGWTVVLLLFLHAIPSHSLAGPPQRIIPMAPSITESLFALGAGDRVIGRTDFCSWPKEACTRPNIGGMLNPSIETWLKLQPDLIIFLETSDQIAAKARSLGLNTLMVNMNRLEDVFASWKLMGETLAIPDQSNALIDSVQEKIDRIQSHLKGIPRKKTLLLLGDSSDPSRDLYAVGPSTFLGQLIDLAGGDNILDDTGIEYPRISKEFIMAKSPEVIIEAGPKARLNGKEYKKRMQDWQRFSSIHAVQNRQIYFVGEDYAVIPGPRLYLILQKFAGAIHPDLFDEDEFK